MSDKPKLFLHIGYAKTGTTSLQRTFFDKHPDIEFLGNIAVSPEREKAWKEFRDREFIETPNTNNSIFFDDVINTESIFFDDILVRYKNIFSEYINPNKVLVYSLEDFVTNDRNNFDLGLIANRLHSIFSDRFDVHILATIREQKDILPSYFNTLYTGSYRSFIDRILRTPMQKVLASFFYFEVLDYYVKLFGRDKVHVMLFEDFINERKGYIEELSKILGIKSDFSLLQDKDRLNIAKKRTNGDYAVSFQAVASIIRQRTFLRYLPMNKGLFKRLALFLTKVNFPFLTLNMTDSQKETIDNLYRDSNTKLMKEFNLNMWKYNYSLKK